MNENMEEIQYVKMTKTPVSKLVISLGIPTIISMLITSIYNIVDTYFVGKLGTSASGAVGVVFGLMAILQAFGFMFGHGCGSIISRKLGGKEYDDASKFASTGFFVSLFVGFLIAVFGILFLSPFMKLLGSTNTILPYAKQYGLYILISAPFLTGSCVLNNILRYEGRASLAMIGLTLGGVLNIIADPIFMFGLKMGISGAGLSTAISQTISFFVLLSVFLLGKTESKISLKLVSKSYKDVFLIISVGLPSLLRQGLNSIATMMLNKQAGIYGDAAVAAMSIVNKISMFIFSVGLGMGQGFQPVSAFNYGAKIFSRVKKSFIFTVAVGELMLGVLSVCVLLISGTIIGVFRDDPEVIKIGIVALRWQCIGCFFLPLTVCTNMMFQSVGKSFVASLLSAFRSGIFFIPFILILPNIFGLFGVQITQFVADFLSFAVSIPFLISFFKNLPKDDNYLLKGKNTNE